MTDLPNRRQCLGYRFDHGRFRYFGTIGFDPRSMRPCEIFLQVGKAGTEIEMLARAAAVLASVALQHGATVDELRSALTRLDAGEPAGPVAALLDIYATDMALGMT
jgi:ribonucleoside-diphosphate reductase alpha chain